MTCRSREPSCLLARRNSTSSFAGVQLFGVLAGSVVSGAAVFNPSDFGGNDLARVGDFVVRFALDPTFWRDLNGGDTCTYADLSLFQVIDGLRYAFPNAMTRLERKVPRCVALHDRVVSRPRIATYLASGRRIAFNEQGIFRHYRELDASGGRQR